MDGAKNDGHLEKKGSTLLNYTTGSSIGQAASCGKDVVATLSSRSFYYTYRMALKGKNLRTTNAHRETYNHILPSEPFYEMKFG